MAKEPNVKDLHDGKSSNELTEFISKLRKRVENDQDNRIEWKRKLVTSNNQRMGLKRVSNRPYVGAPNIPLPEADKLISKQKPNFILSAIIPKKKAFVRVQEGSQQPGKFEEQAKRAELGLNHVLNNKINLLDIFTVASDNFLEKGHCIFKVIEKFRRNRVRKVINLSEFPKEAIGQLRKANREELVLFASNRFGLDPEDEDDKKIVDDIIKQFKSKKDVIEFEMDMIESFPDIIVRPPEKVTPPSYALDIENVERITDEFFLTKRELFAKANEGIYDKEIVKKLDDMDFTGKGKSPSEDSMIETSKERNEGITDEQEDELFRVQEIYTWWKLESSDRFERWVFTILADVAGDEEALIRKVRFPFEIETWNFVKHDNEVKDVRWHASRGIPEKIRALQEFMEKAINNMLIRDEINNAPSYTVLSNSNITSNSIRFIPGQKIKVKSHQEIARLDDLPRVDVSSERIGQLLKAHAEEYLGSTDQLFKNATNKGGGKTLGEVQLGVQATTAPLTLAVMRWLKTLKKLYTMVFDLLKERMGESMFIDGMEVTREDFNFPADIIPNGSLDLAEQALREQKAFLRLQAITQGPPDIINADDRYNAYKDWLDAGGVMDPDRYITRPEEIQQQMREQAQAEDQILQQQAAGLDQEISQAQERGAQNEQSGQTQGTQQASR
tara:strand:+ start:2567 stop:4582 length:2016 start_codon:yes stop_codon:yes gene_type:complete